MPKPISRHLNTFAMCLPAEKWNIFPVMLGSLREKKEGQTTYEAWKMQAKSRAMYTHVPQGPGLLGKPSQTVKTHINLATRIAIRGPENVYTHIYAYIVCTCIHIYLHLCIHLRHLHSCKLDQTTSEPAKHIHRWSSQGCFPTLNCQRWGIISC